MAESTWETVAVPILEEVAARETDGRGMIDYREFADVTGADVEAVAAEVDRLLGAGYLSGRIEKAMGGPANYSLSNPRLAERGSRTVGQWPADNAADALLELIDQRLASPDTSPETKSKLKGLRSAVGEVGKSVATVVLVALVKSQTGLA